MKDFMLIFVGAPYEELGLSPQDMQSRMAKWQEWHAKMDKLGIVKGGNALHAKAKRITSTDRVVSDGPFVEAKELVGGYYVVKAENMDAAVEIAMDYPDFDLEGGVEVREVIVFG